VLKEDPDEDPIASDEKKISIITTPTKQPKPKDHSEAYFAFRLSSQDEFLRSEVGFPPLALSGNNNNSFNPTSEKVAVVFFLLSLYVLSSS
jgi:hypothetical protein